jgi:hypothetical protein
MINYFFLNNILEQLIGPIAVFFEPVPQMNLVISALCMPSGVTPLRFMATPSLHALELTTNIAYMPDDLWFLLGFTMNETTFLGSLDYVPRLVKRNAVSGD